MGSSQLANAASRALTKSEASNDSMLPAVTKLAPPVNSPSARFGTGGGVGQRPGLMRPKLAQELLHQMCDPIGIAAFLGVDPQIPPESLVFSELVLEPGIVVAVHVG